MELEARVNSNNRINHQMHVDALGSEQMLLGSMETKREMLLADCSCHLLPLFKDRLLRRFLASWVFFFSSSDSGFFCFVSNGFLAKRSLLLSQPLTDWMLGNNKRGTLDSHASTISSTPFRLLEFATPFWCCSSKISFTSRTLDYSFGARSARQSFWNEGKYDHSPWTRSFQELESQMIALRFKAFKKTNGSKWRVFHLQQAVEIESHFVFLIGVVQELS
jgi:hypothetical protein